MATADDIEKLSAEEKPLQFPNDGDLHLIENTFNGLQTKVSIPSQLLTEALHAAGTLMVYIKTHGSVSCGPRKRGAPNGSEYINRNNKVAIFTHS